MLSARNFQNECPLFLMQTWADYLDGLKAGAKVIPLKRQAE